MKQYFVEVRILRGDEPGTTILNRVPAIDLQHSLLVAQGVAHRMFPEDIEALNTFQNGLYTYWNTNDMGDEVLIRPVIEPTPSFELLEKDFPLVQDSMVLVG